MIDIALLPIAVKMAVTAAIVIAAALAAERASPQLGGLIASLPVSAGPAFVFLAMKAEDGFIAAAALGSLFANAATALFLLFLALFSARLPAIAVFGFGLMAWTGVISLLRLLPETLPVALALNLAFYGGAIAVTRRMRFPIAGGRAAKGWIDLLLRALLIAALVGTVVTISDLVGPSLTGVVALFPMTFTSVGLLIHTRLGGDANAAAMASGLVAMVGFTLGLLTIHLAAEPLGSAAALALALCFPLGWSGLLLAIRRRGGRAPRARP
jgi:hypothetical protein